MYNEKMQFVQMITHYTYKIGKKPKTLGITTMSRGTNIKQKITIPSTAAKITGEIKQKEL
jgi:hypothetical protein